MSTKVEDMIIPSRREECGVRNKMEHQELTTGQRDKMAIQHFLYH